MPKKPYKFNEERRQKFLQVLRQGESRQTACETVGLSRVTVWLHVRKDAEFESAIHDAEMAGSQLRMEKVKDAHFEAAESGNVAAIRLWYEMNGLLKKEEDRRPEEDEAELFDQFQIEGMSEDDIERNLKSIEKFIRTLEGSKESTNEASEREGT